VPLTSIGVFGSVPSVGTTSGKPRSYCPKNTAGENLDLPHTDSPVVEGSGNSDMHRYTSRDSSRTGLRKTRMLSSSTSIRYRRHGPMSYVSPTPGRTPTLGGSRLNPSPWRGRCPVSVSRLSTHQGSRHIFFHIGEFRICWFRTHKLT